MRDLDSLTQKQLINLVEELEDMVSDAAFVLWGNGDSKRIDAEKRFTKKFKELKIEW